MGGGIEGCTLKRMFVVRPHQSIGGGLTQACAGSGIDSA